MGMFGGGGNLFHFSSSSSSLSHSFSRPVYTPLPSLHEKHVRQSLEIFFFRKKKEEKRKLLSNTPLFSVPALDFDFGLWEGGKAGEGRGLMFYFSRWGGRGEKGREDLNSPKTNFFFSLISGGFFFLVKLSRFLPTINTLRNLVLGEGGGKRGSELYFKKKKKKKKNTPKLAAFGFNNPLLAFPPPGGGRGLGNGM